MRSSTPLLLASLAGVSLAAGHAPVGVGVLAFATPALLVASLDLAPARLPSPGLGALAGVVGHGILLWWVLAPAGVVGWSLLVALHGGWWALLAAVVRWLPRTRARPALVGIAWVGIDAVRGVVPLNGFAWGTLGAATVDLPWLAPLARLAGEKAMTLAVVLLSVAAWEALRGPLARATAQGPRLDWARVRDALPEGRDGAAWLVGTALVVTLATVEPPAETGSADVLLVQPSGAGVWSGTGAELDFAIARSAVDLTSASVDEHGPADVTVWPESTIDADPAGRPGLAAALADGGRLTEGRLLVGANLDGDRPRTFRNTVLAIDAQGGVADLYQKRRLVPFGEYVPFRSALDWFPPLDQVPRDALPGGEPRLLSFDGLRVAAVICFETLFGDLVRQNVLAGDEPAQLVVTATNDASFGRSGEARQHVAQSQLRALETGRWVAHAAISGRSAFIDPNGQVHQLTDLFRATTIRRDVGLVTGRTPYLVTGDWLGPATAVGLLVLALLAGRRRRTSPTRRDPAAEDVP